MALNFLDLTNRTLRRFGSKEAVSATFETTTDPEIKLAKDSVNDAIQDINMYEWSWPFNVTTAEITMVAGTQEYATSADTKYVDLDTVMLKKNDALSVGERWLKPIDFDEYTKTFAQRDGDATSSDYAVPERVFTYPNGNLGFTPRPNQAYTVRYTKYLYPVELTAATDTTLIPDAFGQVIINGACWYLNSKRGNENQAAMFEQKFKIGVSRMRSILTNSYPRVKDTRLSANSGSIGFVRVT